MSRKFKGFVAESSYGKNFLQNYEGFLIHCEMTAWDMTDCSASITSEACMPIAPPWPNSMALSHPQAIMPANMAITISR